MRTTMRALTASAIALALAVTGAPSGAADEFSESVQETYIVPTRHGDLYVEVVRPLSAGADVAVPAILTLSPYSVLGRNSDADHWWPRDYARVWADVVGTGNSGGCYDYGGTREKETGYDLVEWIAA
jgi:X-Pro dipeptidyl-peptidase